MARRLYGGLWLLAVALAVAMASLPIGIDAQLLLGLACIGGMMLVRLLPRTPLSKHVFLALGTFVVMRYVFWRTTATLPPAGLTADFLFGLLLYAAEMYCVLVLALSLFIVSDPVPSREAPRVADPDLPSVDVFVPSYNEDADLLAATLTAARAMDYPAGKLTVYLLDDGGTDAKLKSSDPRAALAAARRRASLQELCAKLGVRYLARARNDHAKAGNLNAALEHSTGDLIAVFDADHAPFRSFLRETVGFFVQDPRLFLVQTPHVFLNPDPIEKNLRTFKTMPSENEMFYGLIQRGLDRWNASFFCGSAALLRRRALNAVGGFSGVTITEDCETALDLHGSGWTSVYVDKPLIAGLQPETLASFIGQRSRWCRGMIQILLLKNPLFRRGLTMAQRICYVSNPLFWFFPFPRLAFTFAPLLYIFFSLQIYVANLHQMVAYTLIYMAVNVMMQNYLYGQVRWPWVSELYEYVQSIYLARAIVSVIANPRKPTFNVTAKSVTLDADRLSELARPYFAVFGLLLAAGAVAVWRLATEPVFNELLAVVLAWNTFNLGIAGAALGAVTERRELRRNQRLDIERQGLLIANGAEVPVMIEDVSAGGARVRTIEGVVPVRENETLGTLVVDQLRSDVPVRSLSVVIRRMNASSADDLYGLQFFQVSPAQMRLVADLMYGDFMVLDRSRQARRTHKGVFSGSLHFLTWSLRYSARACGFALRLLLPGQAAVVAPTPRLLPAAAAPAASSPPPAMPASPTADVAEAARDFKRAVSDLVFAGENAA